jgi:hypothetical protein
MEELSDKIFLVNEEIDLSLNMGSFTVHKGDILFFSRYHLEPLPKSRFIRAKLPVLYKIYFNNCHTIEIKKPNLPLVKLPNSSKWFPFVDCVKRLTDITTEYNRNSKLESILNF